MTAQSISGLTRRGVLRWSPRDGWLVAAALVQGAALIAALGILARAGVPGMLCASLCFALSMVWGSNTVSHNHLHNPLFHSRRLNRAFSVYLSVLYAVPQAIWKERHLWHHAGEPERRRARLPRAAWVEIAAIALAWGAVFGASPRVFACVLLGFALGMGACRVQGGAEHAREQRRGQGVSHYGPLYNFLWFNDGHHAEHHRWPGLHWTRLPERRAMIAPSESHRAPLLRWLEAGPARAQGAVLGLLERLPLAFDGVAAYMVSTHERAFRRLLAQLPAPPQRILIVGGGLFPRTLIVLSRLLPRAQIVVVDHSAENVKRAGAFLDRARIAQDTVEFRVEAFRPEHGTGCDLVVCPLAFVGDRSALRAIRAPLVTHDWMFTRGGDARTIISWLLLKRLSLHYPRAAARTAPLPALREAA